MNQGHSLIYALTLKTIIFLDLDDLALSMLGMFDWEDLKLGMGMKMSDFYFNRLAEESSISILIPDSFLRI